EPVHRPRRGPGARLRDVPLAAPRATARWSEYDPSPARGLPQKSGVWGPFRCCSGPCRRDADRARI
ncbi:MAG: hypothetical protein AVDCRST_MAG18-2856, partial [uncultured Thermomicrobiales bacterium]